jgi:hypothetical protein
MQATGHWDGWNSIEGRHLVYAYVFVVLLQGGYFLSIVRGWMKLDSARKAARMKKAAKPV